MQPISDKTLEDFNDMLAAATRDGAKFGLITAQELWQLVCEVQAWRRFDEGDHSYQPDIHEIIPD